MKRKSFILIIAVSSLLFLSIKCSNFLDKYQDRNKYSRANEIANNAVGATNSTTLRTLDFTPSDDNAVFVAKSGNDDSGSGTMENPVLTINKAITICTAVKQTIMLLDSGTYSEKGFELSGNARNLYAALGETPTIETETNYNFATIEAIIPETEFAVEMKDPSAQVLQDGSVFITYMGKYKVINITTGEDIITERVFTPRSIVFSSASLLEDGSMFIAYDNWYKVIDISTGADIISEIYYTASINDLHSVLLPDGTMFIAYAGARYKTINISTGADVISEKILNSGVYYNPVAQLLPDGTMFVAYAPAAAPGAYKTIEINTGNDVLSQRNFCSSNIEDPYAVLLPDNTMLLTYLDIAGFQGKLKTINIAEGSDLIPATTFRAAPTGNPCAQLLMDGTIFIAYQNNFGIGTGIGSYKVIVPKLCHIKISADSKLNGIRFTVKDNIFLESYINATAKLDVKWCTFENIRTGTTYFQCPAIHSTAEVSLSNCLIKYCDAGIYIEANKSRVTDSIFCGNNRGNALYILGAASVTGDIAIDHCDFFKNQSGVQLQGNNGNEIIKNSIFHDNTGYGINADNSITISNSVITNSVLNATFGIGISTNDPLYINEGIPDYNAIDLNLQTIVTGFPADSPAKGLADDYRNAGAYDVDYVE